MIVTAITRQRRHPDRLNIQIDGEYAFAVDELELSGSSLVVGTELSQAELAAWRARSADRQAYDHALRYVSLRRRSRAEIRRYLAGKDYAETTTRQTLSRLDAIGLIDDEAFAEAWISDRQRLRPRSRRALAAELMEKGLDREVITAALAKLDRVDELASLRRLINKKRDRYTDQSKLIAYLSSLGYEYGLIKEAVADGEPDERA